MSERYLDDYLPMVAIDVAVEEKTKVATMAVSTLRKLHNAVQRVKDWRDDSARLKSDIWRLKMALRADGASGGSDERQPVDPLIVHQKTEIGRLGEANGALESEVASLRRALARAEEDVASVAVREMGERIAMLEDAFSGERERLGDEILRLRERLTEAERSRTSVARLDDRTIETILANAIGRVVETIVGLSEELVNVNEDLYKSRTKNRKLRSKVDRLRAMLRCRCGSGAEYRKRIGELNGLAERLAGEMGRLKIIREGACRDESLDVASIPEVVRRVGFLMNDLRNSLKSDREAMIAAGDPNRLTYMRKIIDLRVHLRVLSVELGRSSAPIRERSCEVGRHERCSKATSLLDEFLKEIDTEIGKLKMGSMDKYCRIGGVSGARYMTGVVELESMVKRSAAVVAVLRQRFSLAAASADVGTIGELEDLIGRLCRKMKDLETFDDRASLRERIDRLETSIARLKLELADKDDRIGALSGERASVESTWRSDRDRYESSIVDMRRENEDLRESVMRERRRVTELARKRERGERRAAEVRLMEAEIDAAGKKLRSLRDDKETLLREAERARNILRARDKEIGNIISQRDTLRAGLAAEMEDLRARLESASEENAKWKGIIEGFEKRAEGGELPDRLRSSTAAGGGEGRDNEERSRDRAASPGDASPGRLTAESSESNEPRMSSSEARGRIDCSRRAAADEAGATRPRNEISDLRSNEELSMHRSSVWASAGGAAPRESPRATAESEEPSESKVKHLQNEKEQLGAELSELRSEKGLLYRSTADANNKCTALQDQVNKFKSGSNGYRGEISEREAAVGNLKLEPERMLRGAAAEAAHLRSDNSWLAGDLAALSARYAEAENRARALVTEKNELTTRADELAGENVDLRDRLSETRAASELLSSELNKSRVENDEVLARNALLQTICDERESDNVTLRRERDDARGRLDEICSERRALGEQLRILRVKYEALRASAAALYNESNDRRNHAEVIDARRLFAMEQGVLADTRNGLERGHSDVVRAYTKIETGQQLDDETGLEAESSTRTGDDNEARIDDEPRNESRTLRAAIRIWKPEPVNLSSWCLDVATGPARARDGPEDTIARTGVPGDDETVDSVRKELAVANLRYEEMSGYSDYSDDPGTRREDGEKFAVTGIDLLRAGNRAPKIEADVLRSSLNFGPTDVERTEADFCRAIEEIQALKCELMSLRDERATLRSRLEMFKEELSELQAERVALKDELAAARKSNFDLRLRGNGLRGANERLKETNARLESRLRVVLREANERSAASGTPDKGPGDDVGGAAASARENSRRIKKRLNRFERTPAKNTAPQSVEESLQYVEGQK